MVVDTQNLKHRAVRDGGNDSVSPSQQYRQSVLPTTTITTANESNPNDKSRRSNIFGCGSGGGGVVSLFSKQSIVTLLLGTLVGYLLLPILLVEISSTNIGGTTKLVDTRNLVDGGGKDGKGLFTEDDILSRLIENKKLLSIQSLPTDRSPHLMETAVLSDHRRKKILVTGGAGFVGSHLVDKLMMEGHEVTVLDNFFTGQKKNVAHWFHHPNFSLVVHDVTEPIMVEVDEIYHLACPASPPHYQFNPVKTIKTSTMGTLNMLGLAKRVKAKILLTSTSEIYGDPQIHPQAESYWGNVNPIGPRSCYDEGKRVAETMMYSYKEQSNVEVRVARIFNTFGPRMHPNDGRVVSNFIIQALQEKPLTVYGEGEQTRSFQYVSDLVDGLHLLMNGSYDRPVNLGNPDEFTIIEFAEYIKKLTQSESEIRYLEKNQDDPSKRKPDISLAKEKLGWEPRVTVEEGLGRTIKYFQQILDEAGEIIPTGPGASKPQN